MRFNDFKSMRKRLQINLKKQKLIKIGLLLKFHYSKKLIIFEKSVFQGYDLFYRIEGGKKKEFRKLYSKLVT